MCVAGAHADHIHPLSRRRFLAAAAAGAAVAAGGAEALRPQPAAAATGAATATGGGSIVDLTYPLTESLPWFPVYTPAQRKRPYRVETTTFYAQQWDIWEHTGTHIDAPAHFVANGRNVTQLGLEELVNLPLVVIDVASRAAQNADTAVMPADLEAYEKAYGRIPDGAAVLMHSGWQQRVGSQATFTNSGPDGRMHFPGFSGEAVEWLLAQRNVRGLGVDTLSLDLGRSLEDFPAHKKWLGADRWAMEIVANLEKVPPSGARLFAAVVPYQEGSGGQVRAFAVT
jgi:kynurenine formamidase